MTFPRGRRPDGIVQPLAADAGFNEANEAVLAGPSLWLAARICLVGPSPSHAVLLFRDVGQVEEVREGARERKCRVDWQPGELGGEDCEVGLTAAARALGERAHSLDLVVERLTLVAAQDAAEQFAEQTHILAQRFVRVGVHAATLAQIRRAHSRARTPVDAALPSAAGLTRLLRA